MAERVYLEDLAKRLPDVWVGKLEPDETVSVCEVTPLQSGEGVLWYLTGLCVAQDWRGRGFGRATIAEVLARADEEGAPIFLHVETANTVAGTLYRSLGFGVAANIFPEVAPQLEARAARFHDPEAPEEVLLVREGSAAQRARTSRGPSGG